MPRKRCSPEPSSTRRRSRNASHRSARRADIGGSSPRRRRAARRVLGRCLGARSSAAWMPSVTKWNVVPPAMRSARAGDASARRPARDTADSSPHQPFQAVVRPGPADRAEHVAAEDPCADVLECRARRNRRRCRSCRPSRRASAGTSAWAKTHSCSSSPPTPSGFSRLWSGRRRSRRARSRSCERAG